MPKFLLCPERSCQIWQFDAREKDCPECGTPGDDISKRPSYLLTRDKLYGTEHTPRYDVCLGQHTTGASDFKQKAEAAGLRIKERGEPSITSAREKIRKERSEKRKKEFMKVAEKHKGALNF